MKRYMMIAAVSISAVIFTILVSCSQSTSPKNSLPEIRAIDANPASVFTGKTTQVSCTAIDKDGDKLTYQWTADAGTFENPTAAKTNWTAPNSGGAYRLKCTVSDGHGKRWAFVTVAAIKVIVPEGVAAYWPFESDFNDFAGTNNATKGSSGPVINNDDAHIGIGCAEFNGEDADIQSSILLDGTNLKMGPNDDFTFTLWINTEDDMALLFGKSFNGDYIGYEATGAGGKALNLDGGPVTFDCWGIDAASGSTAVNDGNWHNVGVVKSGLNIKIYVDGKLDGENNFGEWTLDSTAVITMGAGSEDGDTWPGSYKGLMDDVRFYQKALTADDMMAIYNEKK